MKTLLVLLCSVLILHADTRFAPPTNAPAPPRFIAKSVMTEVPASAPVTPPVPPPPLTIPKLFSLPSSAPTVTLITNVNNWDNGRNFPPFEPPTKRFILTNIAERWTVHVDFKGQDFLLCITNTIFISTNVLEMQWVAK